MCGIAGIVNSDLDATELRASVDRMCRAMAHRGPDDVGLSQFDTSCGALGARRLAVLDLSAAGHQPMRSRDGSLCIAYNGEVYNFGDIREQLGGHASFRSRGDTEVVLRAYEADGERCLDRFRGMFAFAVWDERARELFLARDRFGVKPLYYAQCGRTLLFASEIKALVASRRLSLTIDPEALQAYLTFGSIPAPLTIYREIRALEPAHWLKFRSGEVQKRSYWRLPPPGDVPLDESLRGEFRELLLDTIRLRMISDVPIGVFLSGGIDSTAIVSLMREVGHSRIRTFSVAFADRAFNESAHARQIADRFETEHTEYVADACEVLRDLDRAIWAVDQPSIDGVNTYIISKIARAGGVTVALSGLGGDEVFFGYDTFRSIPRFTRMSRALARLPGGSCIAESALSRWTPSRGHKLHLLLTDSSIAAAYVAVRGLFFGDPLETLVKREFAASAANQFDPVAYARDLLNGGTYDSRDAVSRLELYSYMASTLLRDTDVMSMAHSLEVRVPFIDHRLVEFVTRIRAADKMGRAPKPLLVTALNGSIPHAVWQRPKQGFTFPFHQWIAGPWRQTIEELLAPGTVAAGALLEPAAVQKLLREFDAGRLHWSRIWAIAALNWWLNVNRSDAYAA